MIRVHYNKGDDCMFRDPGELPVIPRDPGELLPISPKFLCIDPPIIN